MSDSAAGHASSHTDEGLSRALERFRAIQDEIVRGIAHAMSNRVASLSAGLYVLGENGTASAASVGALQSELDRMEQLLVQLRMLPAEHVPVEPLLASESALTAVALHAHHGELRNVSCVVEDAGNVPPARAEPHALLHALLVAITGYGRASDMKQTQSAGFDHHLVKPVDYEKLQAVLATHCGGSASGARRGREVIAHRADSAPIRSP